MTLGENYRQGLILLKIMKEFNLLKYGTLKKIAESRGMEYKTLLTQLHRLKISEEEFEKTKTFLENQKLLKNIQK